MEVQQTASNQSHQYTPNQAKPVFGSQETNKEKKDSDGFQQVQRKNKNKKNKEQERMKAEAPKRYCISMQFVRMRKKVTSLLVAELCMYVFIYSFLNFFCI